MKHELPLANDAQLMFSPKLSKNISVSIRYKIRDCPKWTYTKIFLSFYDEDCIVKQEQGKKSMPEHPNGQHNFPNTILRNENIGLQRKEEEPIQNSRKTNLHLLSAGILSQDPAKEEK